MYRDDLLQAGVMTLAQVGACVYTLGQAIDNARRAGHPGLAERLHRSRALLEETRSQLETLVEERDQ